MGNCMTNDEVKGSHSYFHEDILLEQKSQIYKPLTTTLYNTLRKTADCAVVTNHKSTFTNKSIDLMKIDFDNTSSNDLKTLLNFKKIVYVGSLQTGGYQVLKKVKQSVSFTKFYVVSQQIFNNFLKEYPVFLKQNWQKYQIVTNKLPLMIIDSNEFVNKTQPRVKLFVHTATKKNAQIYKLIGANSENMMINQPSAQEAKNKKAYYVNALKNTKQNTLVFLHNSSMTSAQICDSLATFLFQKYKLPYRFGQLYLLKNWPQAKSQTTQDIKPEKQQKISKTSSLIITSSERYAKYLQKLEEESNIEKTERAYGLLSTLITNIYSNPNNQQSYRQVKKTNRQMNDLLIKYKHGLKLLDELGFREKDQHWVNTVESKYLKIYKTDFDLGFKMYKNRDIQK